MPTFDRRTQLILILFLAALLFGGGIKYAEFKNRPSLAPLEATTGSQTPALITVHVIGAVEKPGIYQVPSGSRVYEAINQAAPKPEADQSAVNLAQVLSDGQQVVVPLIGENREIGHDAATAGLINLNTASAAELADRLPGIGPTLAQRIVDYRQQYGRFRAIDDIKNVPGIGDKRFQELKHLLTVK